MKKIYIVKGEVSMENKRELNNEELEQVVGGFEYCVDEKGRYIFTIPAGESADEAIGACSRMFNCYGYLPLIKAAATLNAENMIHRERKMIVVVTVIQDPGGAGHVPSTDYFVHDVLCMASR